MIRHTAKRFLRDESGAVTVDWVVLTAALVGLAIAAVAAIQPSLSTLGQTIGTTTVTIEEILSGNVEN